MNTNQLIELLKKRQDHVRLSMEELHTLKQLLKEEQHDVNETLALLHFSSPKREPA